MRCLNAFFFLLLLQPYSQAQSDSLPLPALSDSLSDEDLTLTIVEEMPEFPGGQQALFAYLSSNVTYPDVAIKAGIEGVVYVAFTVEKDGSVGDIEILRGIGGGCDEEVIRLVSTMPAWKPGMQKGKPVSVRYNMPVRFTLSGGKKKKSSKKS